METTMDDDQGIDDARLKSARALPIHTGDTQRRGGPGTGPRESIQEERKMNSLIQQTQGTALTGTAATGRTAPAARSGGSGAAEPAGVSGPKDSGPVSIDATPSSPPDEVLSQVEQAAANWRALKSKGYEVHYSEDPVSRRVTAELRNLDGVPIGTLSPSETVALAAGEEPPRG
jgi:hypothetical protein